MEELPSGRRRVIVEVTPDYIANFFMEKDDYCKAFYIKSGIPKDALFIGIYFDHQRGIFELCYEHPSFDLIEYGQKLPAKHIIIRTYYL